MTLKVRKDSEGNVHPYEWHQQGGIDWVQQWAFRHLFPEGVVADWMSECVVEAALTHGWDVELWDDEKRVKIKDGI